jgi:hypothetical protein
MIFTNSVCIANKTQYFSITQINRLIPIKEIIAVCTESHVKPKIQNADFLTVKAESTCNYYWALKD